MQIIKIASRFLVVGPKGQLVADCESEEIAWVVKRYKEGEGF